jgi:hypothetical protein
VRLHAKNETTPFALQALAKTGDERSIIRNGAPLLDKPLGGGALPEVFPLQLMVNNTIHLLTLELLPFQVGHRFNEDL